MLQSVVLASIVAVPLVGVLACLTMSPRASEHSHGRVEAAGTAWQPPAVNLAIYVSTSDRGEPEVLAGTVVAPAEAPRPLGGYARAPRARVLSSAYELPAAPAIAHETSLAGQSGNLDVLA